MKQIVKKGATSVILEVFIQDTSVTTGAGLTGLVHNTSGLTCYYHRNTASSAVAVTLVDMTVGTFTSSGFKAADGTNMPGVYQLCLPDAAFATGADSVTVMLKGAANMAPLVLEVQLRPAPSDVQSWLETAVTKSSTTNKPEVDVYSISDDATAANNLESAYDGTGYVDGVLAAYTSPTQVTFPASFSTTLDAYKGMLFQPVNGTGGGQAPQLITGYSTGRVATLSPGLPVACDTTTGFVLVSWGNVPAVTGSIGSLATQAKADVNAEVLDVLNVDTFAELSAIPGATTTLKNMILLIYEMCRNKLTQTGSGSSGTQTLFKDDSATALGTSPVTDDGTTFTRGKFS